MNSIKRIRLEKGMTQEQLASAIGVDRSTLACYESGLRDPNTTTLRKMSDVLDCTIDELLAEPAGALEEGQPRA